MSKVWLQLLMYEITNTSSIKDRIVHDYVVSINIKLCKVQNSQGYFINSFSLYHFCC